MTDPYSSAIEQYGVEEEYYSGMEDFTAEDQRLARLTIDHKEHDGLQPAIVDSLSGERMDKIIIIPLVFVKQRIMWQLAMSDDKDAQPICKSVDNKLGFPTLDSKNKRENFDWNSAQLDPANMQTHPENGRLVIPCEVCRFQQWGSRPDNDKPWCNQTRTIPMLYGSDGNEPTALAVMQFKGTSIGPCNAFFASINRKTAAGVAIPAYSTIAEITLTETRKGTNVYQVPQFRKIGNTPRESWTDLSDYARTSAQFLRSAPRVDDPTDKPDQTDFNAPQGQPQQVNIPTQRMAAPPMQPVPPVQHVTIPGVVVPTQQAAPAYQAPIAVPPPYIAPPVIPVSVPPVPTVDPWTGTTDNDDDLPF